MIDKILGIATIGSTLANAGMLHRFLVNAVNVIMLAIISAFMTCLLIAGILMVVYFSLVHYGLDPYAAGIALGMTSLCATLVLVFATKNQLQKLRDLSHSGLNSDENRWPDIRRIVHAFAEGFLNPKK